MPYTVDLKVTLLFRDKPTTEDIMAVIDRLNVDGLYAVAGGEAGSPEPVNMTPEFVSKDGD